MLSKKLLDGSIAFDTSLQVCSDYDFWLRLSTKVRFVALPDPTFKRRRHLGNLSTDSFDNCLTEFQVLEHFYYEGGGSELVPPRTAMKVLSRGGYRAGRRAIREGLRERACQLLRQSFMRHPNLKSLIHWVRAVLMSEPQ
jgi:hypothetical protein